MWLSPGVWQGKDICETNRVLILGESHYGDENNTDEKIGQICPYDTKDVVKEYIRHKTPGNEKAHWDRFFDRVARCFGYPSGKEGLFFEKVWFGNYVPVLCSIAGDNPAEYFMNNNRTEYNNDLFNFVNDNQIDTIVCFSKTVYYNLPQKNDIVEEECRSIELPKLGGRRNPLEVYQYFAEVTHGYCDVTLNKPLMIYGVRHPSAQGGFKAEHVANVFAYEDTFSKIYYKG